ncbi:MAG: septation protein SpoVG family protein [Vigna little leaf phytoplasma]|nr:septation protein SpoVG family protein [Vigna little leaf phytoplasma]MDV3198402.1 septation protein SpoVG family protein [Vigna little leaf phytoplasma]
MLDESLERKAIDFYSESEEKIIPLKITCIKIKLSKEYNQIKLKGTASIIFDNCFVIHNIRIVEGQKSLFVAMPNTKNSKGIYLDIAHPINKETRKMIESDIKDIFQKMLKHPTETIPEK